MARSGPAPTRTAPGRVPGPRHRTASARRYRRERRTIAALFLAPALVILAVLVAWPILNTVWLSLHDSGGTRFVGLSNYATIVREPQTRLAIRNNLVWVLVAPAIVTVLGLVLAVLTQRIRLSTAVKTILFMPMAVSLLSAGVTWRLVYDESPDRGVLNAIVVAAHDVFAPPSRYPGMRPREGSVLAGPDGGDYVTIIPVDGGQVVTLPLVGLAPDRVPADAAPAQRPTEDSGLTGVVWLDFTKGGGGRPGVIDPTEKGLPHLTVEAVRDGQVLASTTTDRAGRFRFAELTSTGYTIVLPKSNFTQPFQGVTWLGPSLVTPSIIMSYLWVWAGFAMMVISAGLSGLPRDALDAARVDGATEWQVFRRVTVPLLRPVLTVVLVTLIINVLKIFDLVYVLAPDSSQSAATVVAVEMYRSLGLPAVWLNASPIRRSLAM